jgi:hypothetical protein
MTAVSSPERSRYYSTRPRRVPPEFCTDELLESCSLAAALLMYRLISQADDQGRLQGSAKRVRATCFGMRPEITERKVAAAITELAEAGFVIRYEIDGRAYLQIDHWTDLQGRSGRRAYASRHPAPAGWTGDWVSVKPEDATEEPDDHPPIAGELRAVGTQDARDLRSPIPVTLPFSSSIPSSGLNSPVRGARGWGSAGDVLRTAMAGASPPVTRPETAMAMPRRSSR